MKYIVRTTYTITHEIPVEADNEEAALNIVDNMLLERIGSPNLCDMDLLDSDVWQDDDQQEVPQ